MGRFEGARVSEEILFDLSEALKASPGTDRMSGKVHLVQTLEIKTALLLHFFPGSYGQTRCGRFAGEKLEIVPTRLEEQLPELKAINSQELDYLCQDQVLAPPQSGLGTVKLKRTESDPDGFNVPGRAEQSPRLSSIRCCQRYRWHEP
jgi:hypothetical protein